MFLLITRATNLVINNKYTMLLYKFLYKVDLSRTRLILDKNMWEHLKQSIAIRIMQ